MKHDTVWGRGWARPLMLLATLGAGARSASAQAGDPSGVALGSHGETVGVGIGRDGETVVAMVRDGRGELVRLDDTDDLVASVAFEVAIEDLVVDPAISRSTVLLADEVVVLDAALAIEWRAPLGGDWAIGHLAVGEHGTVAVVTDTTLRTFTATGQAIGRVELDFDATAGVAVFDAQDLVVVGGTRHGRACGVAIEDAALVAFDASGTAQWDAYAGAVQQRGCEAALADTRLVDVSRGDDGELYVLGEAQGAADGRLFDARGLAQTRVELDTWTAAPTVATARVAYYARFATTGVPVVGQYFGFAQEFSTVRADRIAADVAGNVYFTGATTHTPLGDDASEEVGGAIGFYQGISADFRARRIWQDLEVDDLAGAPIRFAVAADRAIAIAPAVLGADAADGVAKGPSILVLPTEPDAGKPGRRPDRDDVGTFGYESGISGADPSCYCDAQRSTPPATWLAGLVFAGFAGRRRRRSNRVG